MRTNGCLTALYLEENTKKGFFSSLFYSPNPTCTQQGPQDMAPVSCPTYLVSRWVHVPPWWRPGWIFHVPSPVPAPVPARTPMIPTVWSCAWGLLKRNQKAVKGQQTERLPAGNTACSSRRCVCRADKERLHPRSPGVGQMGATGVTKPGQITHLSWHCLQHMTFHKAVPQLPLWGRSGKSKEAPNNKDRRGWFEGAGGLVLEWERIWAPPICPGMLSPQP